MKDNGGMKMKKFNVMVMHCFANEVEVEANTKEDAEEKVKEIDRTTDLLKQSEKTECFVTYKAFDEEELEYDYDDSDSGDSQDYDDEECLIDELY